MAQGIVIKLWNVSAGKGTRPASAQLASSIDYIENPEKVGVELELDTLRSMDCELKYVAADIKTVSGLYVGTRHITDISNATHEMMQVKDFYGKLDGRIATHGVISLDEEESEVGNAGRLMLLANDLMEAIFPDHQVVYAVHTNTENLHVHFILNTVGMSGKKIHMEQNFMRRVLEPKVNELAIQYGFTPNLTWSETIKKDKVPLVTRKIELRKIVDDAIEQTDDIPAFIAYLRGKELSVNVGKQIYLQKEGMAKAMNTGSLGSNYSIEGIVRRMQTKLDPMEETRIGTHVQYLQDREIIYAIPIKLKKYKDMTKEEQGHAVRQLKLGENPWEQSHKQNWAIQSMSRQLNQVVYVYELIQYYSSGSGSAKEAMEEIVKRKKELAAEKKEIRKNLSNHKSIQSIYEEMKKYMVGAYLYDAYGKTTYRESYEQYKALANRLDRIYGKNVEEVAEFFTNQKNQLLYAKAQDQELSTQYKAIKKYAENETLTATREGISFFTAVGHGEALRTARDYGVLASTLKYITAKKGTNVTMRVMTIPEMHDGKLTVETTITILDEQYKVIGEVSSKGITTKQFNAEIFRLAREYGLYDCHISKKPMQKINL